MHRDADAFTRRLRLDADCGCFAARASLLSFLPSTNQNQNKKAHKNGIHKPKFHRFVSLKQVRRRCGAGDLRCYRWQPLCVAPRRCTAHAFLHLLLFAPRIFSAAPHRCYCWCCFYSRRSHLADSAVAAPAASSFPLVSSLLCSATPSSCATCVTRRRTTSACRRLLLSLPLLPRRPKCSSGHSASTSSRR